jgi:hypothetical protein
MKWHLAENAAANQSQLRYVHYVKKMYNGSVHLARKRQTSQFIHITVA